MSANRTVTMRRSSVETAIGRAFSSPFTGRWPEGLRRLSIARYEERVDQCIAEPLLIAIRGPSPIEDQLRVQVGATQRPHHSDRVGGRKVGPQPAALLQPLRHPSSTRF